MPDPFADARRALEDVPAPDLWAEAQRRAADDAVAPLAAGAGRPRHPGRWLAVAAVAALAVGTIAVFADDDDQSVDTSPRATPPSTTEDGMVDDGLTLVGPDGCRIGIDDGPVVVDVGAAEPDRFGAVGSEDQLIFHVPLGGSQVAEVHVPGLVVIDLIGERVEDVELRRGTAQLWFGTDFVQVRWFTGSQEPCDSFTVTVSGGTEDGNRHAAVDLAERILLPDEVEAEAPPVEPYSLSGTAWGLLHATVGDESIDGNGSTFTFGDTEVQWSDLCNHFTSDYQQPEPGLLELTGGIISTDVFCDPTPISDAIAAVVTTEVRIAVAVELDDVTLSVGDTVLTLRPLGEGTSTTTATTTARAGQVQRP